MPGLGTTLLAAIRDGCEGAAEAAIVKEAATAGAPGADSDAAVVAVAPSAPPVCCRCSSCTWTCGLEGEEGRDPRMNSNRLSTGSLFHATCNPPTTA